MLRSFIMDGGYLIVRLEFAGPGVWSSPIAVTACEKSESASSSGTSKSSSSIAKKRWLYPSMTDSSHATGSSGEEPKKKSWDASAMSRPVSFHHDPAPFASWMAPMSRNKRLASWYMKKVFASSRQCETFRPSSPNM